MKFNITIEDNNHIKKFFKNYSRYIDTITNNIKNTLPVLITDKPYKIKTAYGLKYNGVLIYEYKIKLDKFLDCRVAYTLQDNIISVFFISNITIKKDFVNLLKSIDNVA